MPELALLNCRQLVTLAGPARPRIGAEMRESAIVEDGALLARDGRIAATGPRSAIEPLCSGGTQIVDAGGRIALPGFVDAHTHAVFAGTRADEFEQRAAGAHPLCFHDVDRQAHVGVDPGRIERFAGA